MKALRISFPFSSRIGIFCKFGLLELRRPVAVTVWLKEVCTLPVRGLMSWGSASIYVPNSFFSPRCSRIFSTTGCLCRRLSSTSSEVTYWPVLVFFAFSTIFSLSNSTSPTCLGEAMLKVSFRPIRKSLFRFAPSGR